MSEKATITAMREWLKTCPLIAEEQTENGAAFRISGLSPEPVAEFSIEDSPTDPVLTTYFSGRNMAKSYVFLSRREYSEARAPRSPTAAFLSSWPTGYLPRMTGMTCPSWKPQSSPSAYRSPHRAISLPAAPEAAKCRCSSGSFITNRKEFQHDCY